MAPSCCLGLLWWSCLVCIAGDTGWLLGVACGCILECLCRSARPVCALWMCPRRTVCWQLYYIHLCVNLGFGHKVGINPFCFLLLRWRVRRWLRNTRGCGCGDWLLKALRLRLVFKVQQTQLLKQGCCI